MDKLFDLTDKIAVITGGTGTLGRAMSIGLANAGATLIILARDEEKIDEVVKEINASGGQAQGFSVDVLDKKSLEASAEYINQTYGRIDILINGAGGNRAEATTRPHDRNFFELPQDALNWVFDLNLMGTFLPSQVFGQLMTKRGSGVIINISSMASYQPLTRVVAYSAAKSAINNFTQWLATYMASEHDTNIRVNAIAPGFFLGEQNRYLLMNDDNTMTERGQQIIDHTPMKRFGDADDLIGTLLWLCSDASRFVTGIIVPVDGGFSAYSGV